MKTALLSIGVEAAARCLLLVLFLPFSALDKIVNFRAALVQAMQAIPNRMLATILIAGGFALEVMMSLAILSGIADRLAAFVFSIYCIVTAILWKQFWRTPDFKLAGASRGREMFWDFLKNFALAGGFLMLAFSGSAAGVRMFFDHPLASSHPYSMSLEGDAS